MIGHAARLAEPDDAGEPSPPLPSALVQTPVVESIPESESPAPAAPRLDPTRYGDWERNGRCIDF
ncbi:MAG: DUF1674 domain-containing protein [Pseudoxanthomonas sp.]